MAESEQQFGATETEPASADAAPRPSRPEAPSWEGRVLPANTRREDPAGGARRVGSDEADEDYPERTPSGASLWFWWTVATVLGWAVAAACFATFVDLETQPWWWYAFLPLTGLFQWLLLRRHFARASWWLLATAAGAAVAGVVFLGLLALPEATFGPPTSGLRFGISDLTDGLALGVAQWLVLRQSVRGAARWFPATVSPLAIFAWLDFQRGAQAAQTVDFTSMPERIAVAATNNAIAGLLIGLLTGALLMRLVEEPKA
jgi:hypothetical protein